jgi:hypothetical protein
MTPARPPKKRRPHVATPAVVYPPGFFTEPVRAWAKLCWQGPLTVPPLGTKPTAAQAFDGERLAQRGRAKAAEKAAQAGRHQAVAFTYGSMVLPGTPKWTPPHWMARAKGGGM